MTGIPFNENDCKAKGNIEKNLKNGKPVVASFEIS